MRFFVSLAVLATVVESSNAQAPESLEMIKNGMGPVHFLRFSPTGKELVRICQFGGVELLDTGGYRRMRTFDVGMNDAVWS